MIIKQYKYFSICCSSSFLIFIAGCTGFTTKPFNINQSKSGDLIGNYCKSGKQIREFKTSVVYFTPVVEKAIPIDVANKKSEKVESEKIELLKNLFYLIGNETSVGPVYNSGDIPNWFLLSSDSEDSVLSNVTNEDSSTKYKLYTFIVKIENKNKFIVYRSNLDSQRMSYDKSYSTDVNEMINNYTILIPKQVIEDNLKLEFDSRNLYETIILNEKGEVDISKAIERRNDLWKKYINTFTQVKESTSDNSQQYNVELSLDLSVFCKYGRNLADVQSQ